jgi:hypothetical protein
MKMACGVCGKKFKGQHGVAVHRHRAHGANGAKAEVKVAVSTPRRHQNSVADCISDLHSALTGVRTTLKVVEDKVVALQKTIGF